MDSIIFDLDGTLWDSRDTVIIAWNHIIKHHDQINKELTREDLRSTMGLQMQEIGEKLFPYLDKKVQEQVLNECSELEIKYLEAQGGHLYDNVEDVLKDLSQKYQLYIVSNCQHGYIEAFYKYHELEQYFLDYENPGRTGLSKGENIKLIIERNHLRKPVYVGDTEGDLQAAKYAEIPFVYAQYGFGQVSEYDDVIEKFDDLVKMFEAV